MGRTLKPWLAAALAASIAVTAADAAEAPRRHHDHHPNAWRTAAYVGLGYFLFPWSLLFPAVYGGVETLEPINPAEPAAPAPAAAKPCVTTNIANYANKCPAAAVAKS